MGNFDIPLIPPRQFSLNFNCGLISKLNANADDYHRNLMAQMDKPHRFDFFIWFYCTSGTIEQVIDFEKNFHHRRASGIYPPPSATQDEPHRWF